MSATIKNAHIKNSNPNIVPVKTINGVKYVHYSYCTVKHDNFILINGVTYYDVSK
jgi:hypothetical protein